MGNIIPNRAMRRLLKKFGDGDGEPNAKIYLSRQCSCIGANNMIYDPTCPDCIFGFIYEPSPVEELVIRTSVSLRFMTESQVSIYQGGCRITIPKFRLDDSILECHSHIAQGDIIVMKGDYRRERDICQIGKKDYLYAFGVNKVYSVSERRKSFIPETDYTVHLADEKTTIEWLDGGDKPEKFYSVEYDCEINYMVWDDMLKPRGATDSNLPKVVMCRLRPYFDPYTQTLATIQTGYADTQIEGK